MITIAKADKIKQKVGIKFQPFSLKQKKILTWWTPNSPVKEYDGIIADGSIRAGKTLSMAMSFIFWSMESFDGYNFAMCGKTVGSFRRNVWFWLKMALRARGYKVTEVRSENFITIERDGRINYYYIFGGKDERSQDLIQGMTLAGVLFDEVALMPESFVNQATGRCSVEGSKFWFNCNPEGPFHWFKVNWLDKAREKNLLYLHFTMEDNPSLSDSIKRRYMAMYFGVFYKRFILGLWVIAEGIIYDMFDSDKHVVNVQEKLDELRKLDEKANFDRFEVSCDYGTLNPMVFGLWGRLKGKWYKVREYYYDGRELNKQKTDEEYCDDLDKFIGTTPVNQVIIDPSAASFIAAVKKRKKWKVRGARNEVMDGIRRVSTELCLGNIFIDESCVNTIKEFSVYSWDKKASERGEEQPIKQFDHAMDETRYFVNTILYSNGVTILKN